MSGLLLSRETVTSALTVVTALAVEAVDDAAGAGVTLVDRHGRKTTAAATDPAVGVADARQYELGEGPCLTAWRDRTLVRIDDMDLESRWLSAVAGSIDPPPRVDLPDPGELELESAMRPRDAFFAPVEQVPLERAVGRIAAELISPYPPGVPAIAPGEVITSAVLDYLTSGKEAGMLLPDAADAELTSIRVVAR